MAYMCAETGSNRLRDSQGEKSLFYVDFVIRMNNGQVFLFDTKPENSDPDAPQKHNALLEYMQSDENLDKHLKGGIIVHDNHSGNWLYSPKPVENRCLKDGWADRCFQKGQNIEPSQC